MSDVYANTLGTLLGATAGAIVGREFRLPFLHDLEPRPFALLLLVAWAGYRFFPYVPTIDAHKYWNAVKPLIAAPLPPPLDLVRHTIIWLALAVLLEAVLGAGRRRLWPLLLVPAAFFLRILILDTVLSAGEVAGGVLAILLWSGLLAGLALRRAIVAGLFLALLIVEGLRPFEFRAPPRAFGWIPFLSFMEGSITTNVQAFFEKVFTYGGALWLIVWTGWRIGPAAALVGAIILGVRYAEVYLPGRSAEITDFVMLLMLAVVMRLIPDGPALGSQPALPSTDRSLAATRSTTSPASPT
jgi:hypothetical protein